MSNGKLTPSGGPYKEIKAKCNALFGKGWLTKLAERAQLSTPIIRKTLDRKRVDPNVYYHLNQMIQEVLEQTEKLEPETMNLLDKGLNKKENEVND